MNLFREYIKELGTSGTSKNKDESGMYIVI